MEFHDANGDPLPTVNLLDVANTEIIYGQERYIRVEKRWFSANQGYLDSVERRINRLTNISSRLKLPAWNTAKHPKEEDYNAYVATKKGWLLQDQKFLHPGGGARVEPCDLLTPDLEFVHLKKGTRATGVHHQLLQLTGAAILLRNHSGSARAMKRRYESYFNGHSFDEARAVFVAAIARKPSQSLFGKMLLPKIHVLEQARRVRAADFAFAVARVDIGAAKTASKKKGKKATKARTSKKKS